MQAPHAIRLKGANGLVPCLQPCPSLVGHSHAFASVAAQASRIQLLNAGNDVLPVGVPPQSGNVRLDVINDLPALCVICHVNDLLHHVVGILVPHHDVQR